MKADLGVMFRTVGRLLGSSGSAAVPACAARAFLCGAEEEVFSQPKLHLRTTVPKNSNTMPGKKVCIVGSGNW